MAPLLKIFAPALTLALLWLGVASAQTLGPRELTMTRGALAVGDQLLFVSDNSIDDPCTRPCSAERFIAEPGAEPGGLWTLTPTEGGPQWTYNGKPLFLWREIGVGLGRFYFGYDYMADYYGLRPAWIRDPVDEHLAVPLNDPRIASRPSIERRRIVNYGLYGIRGASGTSTVTVCVDERGRGGLVDIAAPSGSAELDALTVEFAQKIQFTPASTNAGDPVAVCGVTIRVDWPDVSSSDTPTAFGYVAGVTIP